MPENGTTPTLPLHPIGCEHPISPNKQGRNGENTIKSLAGKDKSHLVSTHTILHANPLQEKNVLSNYILGNHNLRKKPI